MRKIEKENLEKTKAESFLRSVTGIHDKKKSLIELITLSFDQMMDKCEQVSKDEFELVEKRLKTAQGNMRKLKLEFQKINTERLFYKDQLKKA